MKFVVVSPDYTNIIAVHTEEEVLKMCANDKRMYNDVIKAVQAKALRADGKSLWYYIEDEDLKDFEYKLLEHQINRLFRKKLKQNKKRHIPDLPKEEWKEIPNFPDYQISNYGRIKSLLSNVIMKPQLNYNVLTIGLHNKINNRYSRRQIDRLVLQAFKPTDKPTKVIHKDGNLHNNMLDNLEWKNK